MFGSDLEETYQKAWKKVLNPPRLNIYVPANKQENKEFSSSDLTGNNLIVLYTTKNNISKYDDVKYISNMGIKNIEFGSSWNLKWNPFSDFLNQGYTFEKQNNELNLKRLNFPERVDINSLYTNTKKYNIYLYKRDISTIYLKKDKNEIYIDEGYYNLVDKLNYTQNPAKLVSILSENKMKLSENTKLYGDQYTKYTLDCAGKVVEIAYAIYEDTIIKQTILNNVSLRILQEALKINGIEYKINWDVKNKKVVFEFPKKVYAKASTDKDRLPDEHQKANAEYIYDYYLAQGWSKEATCGLLGNIQQESWFNPGVWQSSKNVSQGYGLVQWTKASDKILKWMGNLSAEDIDKLAREKPKKLMDLQLEWIIKSCQPGQGEWLQKDAVTKYDSPYQMSFDEFTKSNNSSGELALVFHGHYERSSDDEKRKNNRIRFANEWYIYFSDQ